MILEKVLSTTKYVVQNSQDIKINQEKIKILAQKLVKTKLPTWNKKYHFSGSPADTIQYFFLLDGLNFSFFATKNEKRWQINYNNEKISGYFALSCALKKAIAKYPILDSHFAANIPLKTFKEIVAGKNQAPLLLKRWQILKQVNQTLLKKYDGKAINLVKKANHSADKLVELILADFPCFRDITTYKDKKIYMLKRAQIFAGDVWGCLNGKGLGYFRDINKLTCFADYKIPQILHYFGVLEYSSKLLQKIKNQALIKPGSIEEIEIRANTIWAIELIKKEMAKPFGAAQGRPFGTPTVSRAEPAQGRHLPAFQIDWLLWTMAKKIKMPMSHHHTRTIYY